MFANHLKFYITISPHLKVARTVLWYSGHRRLYLWSEAGLTSILGLRSGNIGECQPLLSSELLPNVTEQGGERDWGWRMGIFSHFWFCFNSPEPVRPPKLCCVQNQMKMYVLRFISEIKKIKLKLNKVCAGVLYSISPNNLEQNCALELKFCKVHFENTT